MYSFLYYLIKIIHYFFLRVNNNLKSFRIHNGMTQEK